MLWSYHANYIIYSLQSPYITLFWNENEKIWKLSVKSVIIIIIISFFWGKILLTKVFNLI